jgi:hypothetical protein
VRVHGRSERTGKQTPAANGNKSAALIIDLEDNGYVIIKGGWCACHEINGFLGHHLFRRRVHCFRPGHQDGRHGHIKPVLLSQMRQSRRISGLP